MREDLSSKCISKRFIFVRAVVGAHLWKKSAFDHISKQNRVGAIGQTQTIKDALFRQSVDAGELLQSLLYFGILLKFLDEVMGRIYGAFDPSVRLILAELKHQKYGKLIGGVFLAPEQRDPENVEYSVADLVQAPK